MPAKLIAKNSIGVVRIIGLGVVVREPNGTCYQDLGPDHFDRRAKPAQTKRLVTRLQNLGYAVRITPLAA